MWLGRRRLELGELGEDADVQSAVNDVAQFAYKQFPRADGTLLPTVRPEDNTLVTSPNLRMQCKELAPIISEGVKAMDRGQHHTGSEAARVLLLQAWSSAAQRNRCRSMPIPEWILQ